MKVVFWILVVVGAAIGGGWVGSMWAPAEEEGLLEGDVLEQLRAIRDRLDRIEDSVGEVKESASRRRAVSVPREAVSEAAELEADVAALRDQVAELQGRTDAPEAAVIDARIEALEREREENARRANEEKRQAWVRAGVRKEMRRAAEVLDMNEGQTREMTDALEESVVESMPHFDTLKRDVAPAGDQLAAIAALRANRRALHEEAQRVLTADQYAGFRRLHDADQVKTDLWIDEVEERLRSGDAGR